MAASSRYRSEGSKAAVCPSVRVAVAAFGMDWRRSTRLWLGRAQSLHVRDTKAGRANFKTVVAGVRTSCHSTRSNPDGWCFVDFWCDRFREIVFRMRVGGRISKFPGSSAFLFLSISNFHCFTNSLTPIGCLVSMRQQITCAHGILRNIE